MEIWKDIEGYEELYQVSNQGNIYSNIRNRLLKIKIETTGYTRITLSKESKIKTFGVHRLVAEAFIPNPKNKSQVNHIDGDKQNNKVENLEWNTAKENTIHAHRTGLATNIFHNKKICCIYPNGEEKIFETMKACGAEIGIHPHTIRREIIGYKNRKGFKFKYM